MFFRVITLNDRNAKAERITDNWIANNYPFEDLQKLISDLGVKQKKQKKETISPDEVRKNWKNLAQAMSGRK